jgi:tetratricopeptide (TPR) repeat protein
MGDIHLTRELLRAVEHGDLPARLLTQVGLQHLVALCPHCRREIRAWEQERLQATGARARPPQVLPPLDPDAGEPGQSVLQAAADLRQLLTLPREEREQKIRSAHSRFRGAALVKLLIQESRRHIPADPDEAFHLAELARVVAHHSAAMPQAFDLIALATARMANAARADGNLREAEEHFAYARHVIREQGVIDPEVLAEVDDLEGSLKKDQRLFPMAEELLSRAAILYRLVGLKVGVARVTIKLADTYFYRGEVERAIETVQVALRQLQRPSEPRLYLCARYNLATYLAEAGRYLEAAEILTADLALYREFPEPWTQLRRVWLEGRIAAGLGNEAAAEEAFLAAREGFVAEGIGYDAAMVSLDLALLYLTQRRTRELREIAEMIVPLLEAQDVHREAAAALVLFQDSLRQEAASAGMIRELYEYLRAARTDPTLRYREPS